MLTEHTLDRFDLRHVTKWCGCTVCIDEINLLGLQTGIFECQTHYTLCTLAFRIRCSHMVCIGRHSFAYYLRIYLRATCNRVLVGLKDETSRTFT